MPLYTQPQVRILGASAVAVSCPADTSEDVLATIPMAAGIMGVNGVLRITSLWTVTNSANNKTLTVRCGASGSGLTGDIWGQTVQTTVAAMRMQNQIQNRNSAASQVLLSGVGTGGWGTTTAGVATSTRNTAVATDIVFTGQKASAGETLTLESYLIELIVQ